MKLAILVEDGRDFESWEIALFERLARNQSIALEAFVQAHPLSPAPAPSIPFRLVSALDRRLFGGARNASFEGVMTRFAHVPLIAEEKLAEDPDRFDIVLSHMRGTPGPLPIECWEYHFNSDASGCPEAFGFHEALTGEPVTRAAVLRRSPDGTQELARDCKSGTKFSAAFNAAYAKGMLPSLVERELMRAARGIAPETKLAASALEPLGAPREPTLSQCALYCGKLAVRLARRLANSALSGLGARPGDWSLVISEGDIFNSPLDSLTELKQPKGEFRADPFLFERDGAKYVFFEACDRKSGIGRIDVGRIEGDRIDDVRTLDLGDAHHSYPFVFEHGGEVYMIPETHQRDRVEVWKCSRFPYEWTLHATALEGQSPVDTVFVEWEGQCWLFTNLGAGSFDDHCAELHVYRVDGPDLAKVEPHARNPVVLDTTSARNGGRPFVRNGKLIRPAQITSHGFYGYGLKLLEVTRLSMEEYSETEIRRIEPRFERKTTGCHHFDLSRDTFIMDARRAYGARLFGARPIAVRAT